MAAHETEHDAPKLEKSKDGKSVNFRLDIQVACPEQGAAPQG